MDSNSRLDRIDIEILRRLQENARLTVKELAAAVHLSPTPTYERMKRLEREGYIRKYMAVIDAEKVNMGLIAFCFLKMKQMTYENAAKLMEIMEQIEEVTECYNISGEYDFLLKIYTSDMKSYQNLRVRILCATDCIGSINTSFVLGEAKNTRLTPVAD